MIDIYKRNRNLIHVLIALTLFVCIYLLLFAHLANAEGTVKLDEDTAPKETSAFSWSSCGTNPIVCLIYPLYLLFSWVLALAASMMDTFINPSIFSAIFSDASGPNETIKAGWYFVRDFFNIFFILILLFSAFATIFQVEKFHLKRTLLMIVLMALLVNFSWPIARVIIDFGNVMMYFFLDAMTNGSGSFSTAITSGSGIGNLITDNSFAKAVAQVPNANVTTNLFVQTIFLLLLAVTLIVLAVIFLLRLVMLIILLIFSPIGFVAAVLPSTQKFASMWWDNLFKWVFIGPIMAFMLVLSIKLMSSMNNIKSTVNAATTSNSAPSGGQSLMANAIMLTTALVILWSSIIVANKIGGSSASMVLGQTKRFGKWTGGHMRRAGWGLTKAGGRVIDQGISETGLRAPSTYVRNVGERWNNVRRKNAENYQETIDDGKARGLEKGGPGGDAHARERFEAARLAKLGKELNDTKPKLDTLVSDMETAAGKGDLTKTEAYLNHMAKSLDSFGKSVSTEQYGKITSVLSQVQDNDTRIGLQKQIEGKMKDGGTANVLFDHAQATRGAKPDHEVTREVLGGMSGAQIAKNPILLKEMQKSSSKEYANAKGFMSSRASKNSQFINEFKKNAGAEAITSAKGIIIP